MEAADENRVPPPGVVVTVPGHDIDVHALTGQPKDVATMLTDAGRVVGARMSETFVEGAVYKTGKRAGEKRADKTAKHYAIATLDRQYPVVYAVWIDGKLTIGRIRLANGNETQVELITTLKKVIKEAIDAEVASVQE